MTWTFNNAPATVLRDAVRLEVGDTKSTDPQLSDETIAYLLSKAANDVDTAAALAAELIAAGYARQVNKSVGPVSVSYEAREKHYLDLADRIWTRSGGRPLVGMPYAGGISIADKEARALEPDRTPPAFTRDTLTTTELPAPDQANESDPRFGWPL